MPGAYIPGPLPHDVWGWLQRELQSISEASQRVAPYLHLDVRNVAPERPRDGMLVIADGTNWNPGSGAGAYAHIGGSWVKL